MGLREAMREKSWLGWTVAGVFAVAAIVMLVRSLTTTEPDSIERRSQTVTIRCTETGQEWTMNRGRFERLLMTQDGQIDPQKGIPSEFAEGRLTGFLVDKDEWEETVERINAMKRAVQQQDH